MLVAIVGGWTAAGWLNRAAALESGYLADDRSGRGTLARLVAGYDRVRGVLYFRRLAQEIVRGAETDRQRVERLLEWTYLHVRPHIAAPTRLVASDPYNVVKRGFGYCDQSAHVFSTLAYEAGLSARLYFLRDGDGQSRHTVAQVSLGGEWVFVDTLIGRLLEVDGAPLRLEALQENPSLIDVVYLGGRDVIAVGADELLLGEPFAAFPYGGIGSLGRWIDRLVE